MKRLLIVCAVLLVLSCVAFAGHLPDTGQTKCYDNTQEITCPNPGEPFYGQDGTYSINPPSYTKLDASGNDLPDEALSWVMVRDNVTGLVWEVKQDKDDMEDYANHHDADNFYTWYDGVSGTPGEGTDTFDFLNELNASQFGGYNDWRIPTMKELTSILHKDTSNPYIYIHTSYFPNTLAFASYWSSNFYPPIPEDYLDGFNFSYCEATQLYMGSGHYVRSVRGGQFTNNFINNGDGTVTDTSAGLMWQQDSSASSMNWESALSSCENLSLAGYDDWRLPNVKELHSIVDYSTFHPTINITYFPTITHSIYWTSTTNYSTSASIVQFWSGGVHFWDKYDGGYVRAVRGGQCGPLGDLDGDTVCNDSDNCPNTPNPFQEDNYPSQGNGIGDACDCEADFICDGDVDGEDLTEFLSNFGRNMYHPFTCTNSTPCPGDFICDTDVDGADVTLFLEDFGRGKYSFPCPICDGSTWCSY